MNLRYQRLAGSALLGLLLFLGQPAWATISPLDYGARCDGVADDSSPLQTSLDVAAQIHDTVLVPVGGICRYSTDLVFDGDGAGVSCSGQGGGGFYYVGAGTALQITPTSQNLRVSGCKWLGTTSAQAAIQVSGTNTLIERVYIKEFMFGAGIILYGAIGAEIAYVIIENTYHGIKDTEAAISVGTRIFGGRITTPVLHGVYLRRVRSFSMFGTIIEGCGGSAVYADAVTTNIESVNLFALHVETCNRTSGLYSIVFSGTSAAVTDRSMISGGMFMANPGKQHILIDWAMENVIHWPQIIGDAVPVVLTANSSRNVCEVIFSSYSAGCENHSIKSLNRMLQQFGGDPATHRVESGAP